MKKFFWGLVVGILLWPVVGLVIIISGAWNVGATAGPGTAEAVLAGFTVDRSVAMRAPTGDNPVAGQPQAVVDGLHHYREMCIGCHGGPGIKPDEFALGLNPAAPDLDDEVSDLTDGQLFWIVKHGIRMTGMPAFAPTHSDDDIWKIVAAVRSLDHLSADQLAILKQSEAEEHEHAAAEKPAQAAPAGEGQTTPPQPEQPQPEKQPAT